MWKICVRSGAYFFYLSFIINIIVSSWFVLEEGEKFWPVLFVCLPSRDNNAVISLKNVKETAIMGSAFFSSLQPFQRVLNQEKDAFESYRTQQNNPS